MVAARRDVLKTPIGAGVVNAESGTACAVASVLSLLLPLVSISVMTPHRPMDAIAVLSKSTRRAVMIIVSFSLRMDLLTRRSLWSLAGSRVAHISLR